MDAIEKIEKCTGSALQQTVAMGSFIAREKTSAGKPHPQGGLVHVWHDLRQPHSAKHTPSPTAASKASTHGQQNSSTASGAALYTGAFVGMPRSAAYTGVVATVKANRAADPTAIIRRSMAHPPFSINR